MHSAVWSLMQLVQVAGWLALGAKCFARSLVSMLDNQNITSASWLCKMKMKKQLLQMHPEFHFDAVFSRYFRYFFTVYCNRILFSVRLDFFNLFNLSFFSVLKFFLYQSQHFAHVFYRKPDGETTISLSGFPVFCLKAYGIKLFVARQFSRDSYKQK